LLSWLAPVFPQGGGPLDTDGGQARQGVAMVARGILIRQRILGGRTRGGCGPPWANTVKAQYNTLSKYRIRISSSRAGLQSKVPRMLRSLSSQVFDIAPGLGSRRQVALCHRGAWEFALRALWPWARRQRTELSRRTPHKRRPAFRARGFHRAHGGPSLPRSNLGTPPPDGPPATWSRMEQ
jgi:hypothetical protein